MDSFQRLMTLNKSTCDILCTVPSMLLVASALMPELDVPATKGQSQAGSQRIRTAPQSRCDIRIPDATSEFPNIQLETFLDTGADRLPCWLAPVGRLQPDLLTPEHARADNTMLTEKMLPPP